MQQRIVDPPKDQWQHLPTPLTHGERTVYTLFHDNSDFSPEWEMYVQPHLNGLRPDLVFLNPYAGIAVFEIKDWSLRTLQYSIGYNQAIRNPINQLKLYEDEIFNLYCPRLDDRYGKAVITAGLIFTQIPQTEVNRLLEPFRDGNMKEYQVQYPFSGSEYVKEGNIDALFPEHKNWGVHRLSRYMSPDTAADLRGWLKEPAFSKEQRKPLELNPRQTKIVKNPTSTLYRKVKGPAGSGKSQALAARAAVIASENKRVLVCTFNITLMNYLRDLVARHAREIAAQQRIRPQVIRQRVEFRHFHGWCKWICSLTGYENEYSQLWRQFPEKEVLDRRMAELVSKIYEDTSVKKVLPIYDAILVDEGQDYNQVWWQTLRKAVTKAVDRDGRPIGEMLLVADKTQNIYGTEGAWTEQRSMRGTGLSPQWYGLETSYRLHPKIVEILDDFANNFLIPKGVEVDIPKKQTEQYFEPPILKWIQVSSAHSVAEICFEEVRWQMTHLQDDTAIPDIIFLTPKNVTGLGFVEKCEQKGVHVLYTFGQEDKEIDRLDGENRVFRKSEDSRRKKLAFFLGDARVKATTLHSFKGWEGRHLSLYVSRIESAEDCALFYTALSRLKNSPNGSMLTVICSCPELYNFGFENFRPNFQER